MSLGALVRIDGKAALEQLADVVGRGDKREDLASAQDSDGAPRALPERDGAQASKLGYGS